MRRDLAEGASALGHSMTPSLLFNETPRNTARNIPRFAIRQRPPRLPPRRDTMTAEGDGVAAVAGGAARHIPVLGSRAVELLKVRDGGVYIDATFGAGGYTRGILGQPGAQVIGIDRDQSAIAHGAGLVQAAEGRLTLIEDQFSNLDAVDRIVAAV